MDKIQPLSFVVDVDPVPEAVLDASGWFLTEYIEVEWSDLNPTSYLEWYMAQGWVKYDQLNWNVVTGTSQNYTTVYYSKAYLKRRKLQSELVLQDMITEFTDAYNEGRSINDQRYDEIVAIWNTALDKTEDELNLLAADSDAYDDLMDTFLDEFPDDIDDLVDRLDGILDDFGESQRTAIATRFDSEEAKATQSLIDRGLNNTTIANSVTAGLAREEEVALTDFEDTLVARKVEVYLALAKMRADLKIALIDAHNRWIKLRLENKLAPLDFRNKVLTAMLNFMERRSDEYPGLDGLSNIAAPLGYSEGAAVVSLTA